MWKVQGRGKTSGLASGVVGHRCTRDTRGAVIQACDVSMLSEQEMGRTTGTRRM